ncbi:MAG: hypothetical protein KBA06_04140 [Saprospiraceae bacterium]|nr:hypothetical protein [Saprospiraceae bacterium]
MRIVNLIIISLIFQAVAFAQSPPGLSPIRECSAMPQYLKKIGFDPKKVSFTTSDRYRKGLLCIEMGKNSRTFQHPTWKSAGTLAPIAIDEVGNVYVGPMPIVNIYENDPFKQTILYKVDKINAEMEPYIELPKGGIPSAHNAFGIMGLAYNCIDQFLLATSVSGSTIKEERGMIFCIDVKSPTPKITDTLFNIDAIGIGLAYFDGEKRVFFGKARTSEIYSIAISSEGKFIGEPRFELSLEDLGLRGDDKARKIRCKQKDILVIYGVEFNFNLIAPAEKQETIYTFMYDAVNKKWILKGIE